MNVFAGPDLIIAVYMDDILIIGRSKRVIQKFKNILKKEYNIKNLGKI
jgi:hypothetical protein